MGSIMTKKGQVTIPIQFREAFNLLPGDEIIFTADRGYLSITKKIDPKAFRSVIGKLKASPAGARKTGRAGVKQKSTKTMEYLDVTRGKADLP